MDCDVCLGGVDGSVEFYAEDYRQSRKPRRCYECAGTIERGQKYWRVGGKHEGAMWSASICGFCYEINHVFSCGNGVQWGNLWNDMDEVVFPELKVTSPCFTKLSFEARQFLTAKWWDWKTR